MATEEERIGVMQLLGKTDWQAEHDHPLPLREVRCGASPVAFRIVAGAAEGTAEVDQPADRGGVQGQSHPLLYPPPEPFRNDRIHPLQTTRHTLPARTHQGLH